MDIDALLRDRGGIRLDIGCGQNKQTGFVGMDVRDIPGHTDIVWDFNVHPWPLPDGCVLQAIASHVLEHVPGVALDNGRTRFPFLEFMDEVWRVLKIGGEFAIAAPHGNSFGFQQDPTHVNAMNEARWAYFDPLNESGLWLIYRPKPWRITHLTWSPEANIEVVLAKRDEHEWKEDLVTYE
jgi:hypothetical protein